MNSLLGFFTSFSSVLPLMIVIKHNRAGNIDIEIVGLSSENVGLIEIESNGFVGYGYAEEGKVVITFP